MDETNEASRPGGSEASRPGDAVSALWAEYERVSAALNRVNRATEAAQSCIAELERVAEHCAEDAEQIRLDRNRYRVERNDALLDARRAHDWADDCITRQIAAERRTLRAEALLTGAEDQLRALGWRFTSTGWEETPAAELS